MNPKVDAFLSKAKKWQQGMTLLREILLACNLKEDYKWMHPCYTYQDSKGLIYYIFHPPKQAKTRESIVEKYSKKILEGKGLDD